MWKGGPSAFHKGKSRGLQKESRAGSFEKGRPPVVAGYSLCEPVSVCLSLFTSLSQVVVAAAPVKILQPSPPGKSRVSRRHKTRSRSFTQQQDPIQATATARKWLPHGPHHCNHSLAHSPCPRPGQGTSITHLRKSRPSSHTCPSRSLHLHRAFAPSDRARHALVNSDLVHPAITTPNQVSALDTYAHVCLPLYTTPARAPATLPQSCRLPLMLE